MNVKLPPVPLRSDLFTAHSMDSDDADSPQVDPRQENLDLRSDLAQLTELSASHAQKITQLTGTVESLRSERDEIEKCQAELGTLKERLAQTTETIARLQARLKSRPAPPASAAPKRTRSRRPSDERHIDEIERQLSANKPQVSALEVNIRDLHAALDRTERKTDKCRKKRDDLGKKLTALGDEVTRVRTENAELAAREANDLELVEQARRDCAADVAHAAAHLQDVNDAKKAVERQMNALHIEMGKLKKQFAVLKRSEEAALQANRDYVKNLELVAEPRTLGVDVARRNQRRAANRDKVRELYEQFVKTREDGGELAELRGQLVELKVTYGSIDTGELQEEEDDGELTADELIERIGKIRKKRNAVRDDVAVLRRQADEERERASDTRWRITEIKEVIDSLMSRQMIKQIAVEQAT